MKNLPVSKISKNMETIGMFGWDIHENAATRKANGEDVLLLTIGDPDFPTPDFISSALFEALLQHRTHYANPRGEYRLRQTLADLESANTGKQFSVNQFNVFNGASNALYSTLSCIADPGKNVVLIEPYYIGYQPILAAVGVTANIATTDAPHFNITVATVESAIDDNTVAVLLNTPVNPSGHVVAAETMRAIYELCRQRNIWLISDEVYSLLYYEKPHTSMLSIAEDLSNIVVVDSLSKSHAMSGWRIGWAATNEEFSTRLSLFALSTFFACNQFVQDAAMRALQSSRHQIDPMRTEYRKRRDYTIGRIRHIDGIDAALPSAGMFVMADVHQDGYKFAQRMLDDIGVSVAAGFACGNTTRNHVRISLGLPMDELKRAWDRIEDWMSKQNKPVLQHNNGSVEDLHVGIS